MKFRCFAVISKRWAFYHCWQSKIMRNALHCSQVRYGQVCLRDSTLISPYPILLFGGDIEVQHKQQMVTIDDWVVFRVGCCRFTCRFSFNWVFKSWHSASNWTINFLVCLFFFLCQAPAKTAVVFKEARRLVDDLLQRKLENPSLNLASECCRCLRLKNRISVYL